jgi:HAAS domain-containing protein
MSATDRLVTDYLAKLESELAGIPRAGRREMLDEVRAHIADAAAGLSPEDEVGMHNILERLGDPSEIAAEARERFGVRSVQTTWREIGALILLPFGGVVFPVVGWLIGVALLWVSDAWSSRDKLIGTLLIPGGLVGPVLLVLLASNTEGGVCHSTFSGGPTYCGGDQVYSWPLFLFALLVVIPLAAEGYLIWRLRTGARST